jgi:hypothetical protein
MGDAAAIALLRAWEDGGSAGGEARAVALAAADRDPETVWDLPLGARNTLLLGLRERCFGTAVACSVTCPGCEEELDVEFDLAELTTVAAADTTVEVDGATVVFRPVTSRDVATTRAAADPRRALVLRCVLDADAAAEKTAGPALVEAVAGRLAAADPGADPALDLTCAACGCGWRAPFDVAEHVWGDVDAAARRLFGEVHRLACAYGWREPDVLALSPARRRHYLDLVDR